MIHFSLQNFKNEKDEIQRELYFSFLALSDLQGERIGDENLSTWHKTPRRGRKTENAVGSGRQQEEHHESDRENANQYEDFKSSEEKRRNGRTDKKHRQKHLTLLKKEGVRCYVNLVITIFILT